MTSFAENQAAWKLLLETFDGAGESRDWPRQTIRQAAGAGIFRGMVSGSVGGWGWSASDQCRALIDISSRHLPTAFAITQLVAAIKRIAASDNDDLRDRVLGKLLGGDLSASVGISQLTTSGQHLDAPEMVASRVDGGWRLDGRAPWITGAPAVDAYVIGAVIVEPDQDSDPAPDPAFQGDPKLGDAKLATMMAWVRADQPGITPGSGNELVAMSETKTDSVSIANVFVPQCDVIEPAAKTKSGRGGAGGLQTSALAIGLASASIESLQTAAIDREALRGIAGDLAAERDRLRGRLFDAADHIVNQADDDAAAIRFAANDLALRSSHAELVAAKGAGFIAGHPAGVHCQQALFFLVWSCPASVAGEHLCRWASEF